MLTTDVANDLAGNFYVQPNYRYTKQRINNLVKHYLSFDKLSDRLLDLPNQFENPQPRPWKPIDWHTIEPNQIIGIDPEVFLSVVVGAMKIEAPIRGYSQVSGRYLEKFHPQMARFVGGIFAEDGSLEEIGLWEKEERQHTPALAKIYHSLTNAKLDNKPMRVKQYQPSGDIREDLYGHGLHRVATEYGATCLYIWLMSHSTGTLQQVLSELLHDEINHMTKFWGFGRWAFPESMFTRLRRALVQLFTKNSNHIVAQSNSSNKNTVKAPFFNSAWELLHTFRRVMQIVKWDKWSLANKMELIFTFLSVLAQMRHWSNSLTVEYLQELFGVPPMLDQLAKGDRYSIS